MEDTALQADRLLRLATANAQAMLDDVTRAGDDPAGRRLRQRLTFLAGELGETSTADLATAAAAAELNYLATWHHERMREQAARHHNSVAILAGDYLYTSAANLVAQLGIRAVETYAAMTARLVTGQLRESLGPAPDEDPAGHYLSAALDKDGTLAATGPALAVLVAGVPEATADAMVELCRWIGVIERTSRDHRVPEAARPDLDGYRAQARATLESLPAGRVRDRLGHLLGPAGS